MLSCPLSLVPLIKSCQQFTHGPRPHSSLESPPPSFCLASFWTFLLLRHVCHKWRSGPSPFRNRFFWKEYIVPLFPFLLPLGLRFSFYLSLALSSLLPPCPVIPSFHCDVPLHPCPAPVILMRYPSLLMNLRPPVPPSPQPYEAS